MGYEDTQRAVDADIRNIWGAWHLGGIAMFALASWLGWSILWWLFYIGGAVPSPRVGPL